VKADQNDLGSGGGRQPVPLFRSIGKHGFPWVQEVFLRGDEGAAVIEPQIGRSLDRPECRHPVIGQNRAMDFTAGGEDFKKVR